MSSLAVTFSMSEPFQVHRGDIWFVELIGGGNEQTGKRPALILQNEVGNMKSGSTIVAPITSAKKQNLPTHVLLDAHRYGLPKKSVVLLEQIRVCDKWRLLEPVGKLDNAKMKEVDRAIKISLGVL